MNLVWEPQPQRRVGTAKKGTQLKILGLTQPMLMKLGNLPETFSVRALVVDRLSTPVNIGSSFLQEHCLSISFTESGTSLTSAKGTTELIQHMQPPAHTTTSAAGQYCFSEKNDVKVKLSAKGGGEVDKESPGRVSKESKGSESSGKQGRPSPKATGSQGKRPNLNPKLSKKGHKVVEVFQELVNGIGLCPKRQVTLNAKSMSVVPFHIEKTSLEEVLIVSNLGEQEEFKVCSGAYKVHKDRNNRPYVSAVLVNPTEKELTINAGMKVAEVHRLNSTKVAVERNKDDQSKPAEGVQGVQDTARSHKGKEEAEYEQLLKDLKVEENPILARHPKSKRRLKRMLKKHVKTFNTDKNYGKTDLTECKIRVVPGAIPVKQKVRAMNPTQEAALKSQVNEWLDNGIIAPSRSAWASPVVMVLKKSGEWRVCIDYRRLNSSMIGDSYPLPSIQHLLERAGGHQFYSALDSSNAYMAIPMERGSQHLTAFVCPEGLYEFLYMPFGLRVAGSAYSRFISQVLQHLGTRNLNIYLDDVLLYHRNLEKHLDRLEEVLVAHEEAGIRLNAKKTVLVTDEVVYLGHKLTPSGIEMVEDYVNRITGWPEPTTIKQLNTLLGFLSYYRHFIEGFSDLTAEMMSQKKLKKLDWTAQMSENLKKLKKKFEDKPIRAAPDFTSSEPFILTTDYSGTAIAAILSQVQDGRERLISAGGRKCTGPESRYPSWRGELAAFIYGCRKFESLLRYKEFRLVTDSTGLKHLQTMTNPKGIAGRWIEELQGYRYKVTHRPGRLNLNADNLSRSEHLPAPTKEEEEEQTQWICGLTQIEIATEQRQDPILGTVRKWLEAKEVPTREEMRGQDRELHQYRSIFGALKIEGELLVYRVKINSYDDLETSRVLVPLKLRDEVFYHLHEHQHAGHFGMAGTCARAKLRFYYPGMKVDLQNRIRTCGRCLQKITKVDNKAGAHVPRRSSYPGELVYIDLIGPYEPSSEGFKYALTVEDGFTRFAQIYKLRSKEAKEVARVLVQEYVATWGCPMGIHSDNGKEFTNAIFKELMVALQIKQRHQPAYSPWSNRVERVHRVLNAALRTVLERDDKAWLRYLPAITLAYNSKKHATTGISPFMAMFGREPKIPVDVIMELPRSDSKTVHEYVREMVARFQRVYKYMIKNEAAVIQRNSMQYGGQAQKFQVDQLVWYLSPKTVQGKPAKHTAAWTGPWKVVELIAEVLVRIKPARQEGKEVTVHITRLREYHGPDFGVIPKSVGLGHEGDDDDEDNGDLSVPITRVPLELGIPVGDGGQGAPILDKAEAKQDPVEEAVDGGDQVTDPPLREVPEDAILPEDATLPSGDSEMEERPAEPAEPPRRGLVRKKGMSSDTSPDREVRPRQLRKKRPPESKVHSRAGLKDLITSSETSSGEDVSVLEVPVLVGSALPKKAGGKAAGYALLSSEKVTLPAYGTKAIDLNLALAVPTGQVLQLQSTSALANKGVFTVTAAVDSHYRGRVKCLLYNSNKNPVVIQEQEEVAKGLLLRVQDARFGETAKLPEPGGAAGGADRRDAGRN